MPSTYINSLLANAAYGSSPMPIGWEKISDWPLNDGYSGSAFINRNTKEIVIAHKGSDSPIADPGDWWNNTEHALGTQFTDTTPLWSDQLRESGAYVNSIVKSDMYKDYSISQTGHSLGGFLASVNGAKFKTGVHAFDPPSSSHYLDYLKENGVIDKSQIDFARANTKSYISKGSAIDVIYNPEDYHGEVVQFNLGDNKGGAFLKGQFYPGGNDVISKHSMQNIVDAYNTKTGQFPEQKLYGEPPNTENERFRSFLDEINQNIMKLQQNIER